MAEGISNGTDKYPMGTGGLFTPDVLNHCDLRTFDEVSQFIAKHICDKPIMIETGVMYTWDPEVPYWNTTTSLIKRICMTRDGHLWSLDKESKAFDVAWKAIMELGLFSPAGNGYCSFLRMDATYGISTFGESFNKDVDLLCLDSGEDPDMMVAEYRAAERLLADKHYVLVDDIHNANSVKYLKMVPMLKELGYDWVQVPTHTGLFVAAKGYPVPRK